LGCVRGLDIDYSSAISIVKKVYDI